MSPAPVSAPAGSLVAHAEELCATVTDPELPMLTLVDLGVLRSVAQEEGRVVVTITPTYSGCPAMATMRDDLLRRLTDAGLEAEVRLSLSPAWTSAWITPTGREVLRRHAISPPGPVPRQPGPAALTLLPTRRALECPRCGSAASELTSEFGSTACKALYRCTTCLEPFEHIKEI